MRSVDVVATCLPQACKAETRPCLQSTCKIRSDTYACVFRVGSLPVPSEKNVPSAFSQPIPWLWPTGPSLAMLPASDYCSRTRRERFFRTVKPVPNSALLATNIASIGGAGVRHGEDGRGRFFFARDGLGCYGVALLCLCVRVWECCVEHGSCCLRLARLQARIWGRGTRWLRNKSYRWVRHTRSKTQAMAQT